MSERLDLAIAAYHEGVLDEAGAQLLVASLNGPDAPAVRERIALDGLLGQAFTDDATVERSVRERLAGERSASAVVRAVRQSLAGKTRRRMRGRANVWWPRVAVAALLLLTVGGGLWLSAQSSTRKVECRVEATAALTVQRGGVLLTLPSGSSLQAGDRLRVSDKAALVWPDGSRLLLGQHAEVDVTRPALGPGCRLLLGSATAEIAPQRPGLPFTIATPEARIDVIGTRFRVVAGAAATRVDLHQGIVLLTRVSDARALTLHADEFVLVASGEEFVVHTTKPPTGTATVITPPTEEPAWTPLFVVTGLDGWISQHGMWSNTHGQVRGHDPHGGKARLLGRHPFADVELTCRLRITGVDFAEVQVGDYNWFVEIPAKGMEWIQVELRQRGDVLTITADGVALPLQAGDGKPMRAGALAFYVMPGGTLEIFDARFRILPAATPATR